MQGDREALEPTLVDTTGRGGRGDGEHEGSAVDVGAATEMRVSTPSEVDTLGGGGARADPPIGEASVTDLHAGARIGRFVVTRVVGEGGMGVVVEAKDPELGRRVAIKLVRAGSRGSGSGEAERVRLTREAQAMAQVSHPNLVTVYDVGRWGDEVFIAMEFIVGQTLRAWMLDTSHPWDVIVRVFLAAGEGLAAAHAAGIVHRDFKPENVLVGADGVVKVVDFGLAAAVDAGPEPRPEPRPDSGEAAMQAASAGTSVADDARTMHAPGHAGVLASRLTQTGALLGTPAYMSPEQHRGERADARSDQFSFAVALFEALHGRRPFAGETLPSLVRAVLEGEIVAVETKEVPPSVETPLRRALAVSPEDRHADLRALLDTLRREWEASARPRGDAPQERRSRGDRDAELDATPDTMPPPRDPALARRRFAAAGFVALATILAVAWGLTRRPPRPPEDAGTTAAAERARSSGMSDEEAHRELVAALLASTPDARARLAATYLERFGEGDEVAGGRARGFIASSLIASSAWDGACARPEDGLCVQWDEIPQGEETCAVGGTRRLRVVERDPAESKAGRELAERLVGAVATITPPSDDLEASAFAEAQAKMSLLVLDARLEAMFTTWQGETLTGSAAVERLGQDALSGLDELTGAYESLGEATASYWGVLAWARAGFAREQFMAVHESATLPAEVLEAMSAWDSTASISSPKRHHCNGLAEQLAGLRGQAAGAFATCSTLATKVGVSRGIVRVCDERMQALSSVDVPTLRKTIKGALPAVRACYDGELGEAPELAGRIEVRFVVGADGAVLHARSTEDSDLPVSMQRCVEGVIQGLHFPAPGGRGSVVQYPFVFGPG